MSTNLEIESKSMLEKSEYKRLLKTFRNAKTYKQVNYYIWSDELLTKIKKYGLRIRTKKQSCELTLKITEEVGKTEINQEITRKSLVKLAYFHIFPSGEVADYLLQNHICNLQDLKIVGTLKTTRTDIQFGSSLISIDKSKYNGITDYEIECEDSTEELSKSNLELFLSQNGIVYKKSEHNKLARFIQTL